MTVAGQTRQNQESPVERVEVSDIPRLVKLTGFILTCAFAPPIPKEFTLARSKRSAGHGVGSFGTRSLLSSHGIFGLRVVSFIFGGITRFSRARIHLIMLVMPDAPSEWPTLGLTWLVVS